MVLGQNHVWPTPPQGVIPSRSVQVASKSDMVKNRPFGRLIRVKSVILKRGPRPPSPWSILRCEGFPVDWCNFQKIEKNKITVHRNFFSQPKRRVKSGRKKKFTVCPPPHTILAWHRNFFSQPKRRLKPSRKKKFTVCHPGPMTCGLVLGFFEFFFTLAPKKNFTAETPRKIESENQSHRVP